MDRCPLATHVIATVHPSSILRAPDDKARELQIQQFVKDLRVVARVLQEHRMTKRKTTGATRDATHTNETTSKNPGASNAGEKEK